MRSTPTTQNFHHHSTHKVPIQTCKSAYWSPIVAGILMVLLANVPQCFAQRTELTARETLTLDQAIHLALENNPSVKNARLEIENSDDSVSASKSRRWPEIKFRSLLSQPLNQLTFTFKKGDLGTLPNEGPVPSEDVAITSPMNPRILLTGQVTQPLSQLHRINLNIKQLELGREISQAKLRAQQQAIVNDIKRVYFSILQTQSAFESAEESIKLYRELNRVTGEYVLQQVALKTDQMEVETRLAKAEYEMLTVKNLLSTQKEQLNSLIGRNLMIDFEVTDGLAAAQVVMRETDLVKARERALEQRPEVAEARVRVRQAKYDRRAKKSEFIPDVSLSFDYLSPLNFSSLLPKNIMSMGVLVEWEVFDWGRKRRELAQKDRVVSQADNSLRDVENLVLMEVNSKFRTLQESSQLLRVAQMSQETARANVKLATHKYQQQAVLLKDVLQTRAAFADAKHEYQKVLLSFWLAKADLEKAMGEDK